MVAELDPGATAVAEEPGSEVGAEVTTGETEAGADEAGEWPDSTDLDADSASEGEATMSELMPLE